MDRLRRPLMIYAVFTNHQIPLVFCGGMRGQEGPGRGHSGIRSLAEGVTVTPVISVAGYKPEKSPIPPRI